MSEKKRYTRVDLEVGSIKVALFIEAPGAQHLRCLLASAASVKVYAFSECDELPEEMRRHDQWRTVPLPCDPPSSVRSTEGAIREWFDAPHQTGPLGEVHQAIPATRPPITTPLQIRAYCSVYAKSIYVRSMVNGEMKTVALADLPAADRTRQISDWVASGVLPTRGLGLGPDPE